MTRGANADRLLVPASFKLLIHHSPLRLAYTQTHPKNLKMRNKSDTKYGSGRLAEDALSSSQERKQLRNTAALFLSVVSLHPVRKLHSS